jgi:tryptophan synthase beta subunit
VQATYSISAGMNYLSDGLEHPFVKEKKRVRFSAVTNVGALRLSSSPLLFFVRGLSAQ